MMETPDVFRVELLSSFGGILPPLSEHVLALIEKNDFCLVLVVNGVHKNACTFEISPLVLSTKSFIENIGLLDSFLKNIILFVRIQCKKSQAIRFFSSDDTEMRIMENLEIRYVELDNVVTSRRLTGPHTENGEFYYQYGNCFLLILFVCHYK